MVPYGKKSGIFRFGLRLACTAVRKISDMAGMYGCLSTSGAFAVRKVICFLNQYSFLDKMRGDVETPGTHFRPRHKQLSKEDMEASSSDRGFFEDLERLARTPELRRAWDRVRTAAIRGAAAGILIKGGLHTLTFVVYLLSRIRGKARQRVATLADVLRDTVLHTCFLAALGSSYTAMDEGIALIFGKSRSATTLA